jgi:phosphatidylglycerophosphate synthase
MDNFQHAKREQSSFLADAEKRVLVWMAERMPAWVGSDHLTALGFLAMLAAGLCYWYSRYNRLGLILVAVCLVVNWFGDSLDGTLARVRNRQRPRYGFYVDHILDAVGTFFLFMGLGLSGYMSLWVAAGLLIAYLLLNIEVYLATYTIGKFRLSYGWFSPTELRLLLIVGNLALFYRSATNVFGPMLLIFDIGGVIGIAGMALVLLISIVRHTALLYKAEKLD